MKLTIHPVRRMRKGKVWIVRECALEQAQAYQLRNRDKVLRTVNSRAEAERLVSVFTKPKGPVDKRSLIGKRWNDVKDKL